MERYLRNKLIEGFGDEGQEKLFKAKVLVIGAGGLGSPVLYYLAAAGVGTLGIMDDDVVNVSNLQRQILFQTTDLGQSKSELARKRLLALNPEIQIIAYHKRLTAKNAEEMFAPYDFVVDCSDSFTTKYLINDVCVQMQKPYCHGAITGLRGEVMTYVPGCADYRAVFASPPEEADGSMNAAAGVLGATAGVVGSLQATEVIKYLTGMGELLTNRILFFDGRSMTFHTLKVG